MADTGIERRIIIGLVASDEYIERIRDIFDPTFFESTAARYIAQWCMEYFDRYGQAPATQSNIVGIFIKKKREGKIKQQLADEIDEDIMPSLSDEFLREEFNVDQRVEETQQYALERVVQQKIDQGQSYLKTGEIEKAAELFDVDIDASDKDIEESIQSIEQIEQEKPEKPKMLMAPWLRQGETTLLYAQAGVGKSLIAILTAYLLGLKDYDKDEAKIGNWVVKNTTGTLYIDGEMGKSEMLDRVKGFRWVGQQRNGKGIRILSLPDYQIEQEKQFDLSERDQQRKIIKWLQEHPKYKLLVIDSVSTVFGLDDENSNSEWSQKINPFIRDLRALGVAHIIQHHAGKNGELRGASAMDAMAHNKIRLKDHDSKMQGEAWFWVDNHGKQRAAGKTFQRFQIKFVSERGRTIWFEPEQDYISKKDKQALLQDLSEGIEIEKLAEDYGITKEEVMNVKSNFKRLFLLNENDEITASGREFLKNK